MADKNDNIPKNLKTQDMYPPEQSNRFVIPTPPEKPYKKPLVLSQPTSDIPVGCFQFMSWMVLELSTVENESKFRVSPQEGKELSIGRSDYPGKRTDPAKSPDVDLTAHFSPSDGLSRIHAGINLYGTRLEIEDKNSTNGTSINGIRFGSGESHPIRSGDIIMFGQFQMVAVFTLRLVSSNSKTTAVLTPQN